MDCAAVEKVNRMPRLTIVVPLMDQEDAFEATLASILRYLEPEMQVLVVHTGNYRDPHGILGEVLSVVVDPEGSESSLRRVALGAQQAGSPWILWLIPGIELTEGWSDSLNWGDLQRPDVGLISPRIMRSDSEDGCLASGVTLSSRAHPRYLEELLGEQWQEEDCPQGGQPGSASCLAPTQWAGLCRKNLLRQWLRQAPAGLPDGYAELSLGLMLRRLGWEHQFLPLGLRAEHWAQELIEAGYRLCGRSANQIVAQQACGSGWSRMRQGLSAVASELALGLLSPGQLRVAWERLSTLRFLYRTSVRDQITAGALPRSQPATGRAERAEGGHSRAVRSSRPAA